MNKLLLRQIKRHLGKDFDTSSLDPKVQELLSNISDSYEEFNKEKRFIEHTLEISSNELFEANQLINEKNEKLEQMNKTLQYKVKDEVQKNREKDIQLFSQSKMASLGEMIGNIAHQWRQPLSSISSISTSIKLQAELGILDNKDIIKNMDSITQKTLYLSETINTFRDFIKDNKQIKTHILQDILENSFNIIQIVLDDNKIEFIKNIDFDNPICVNMPSGEFSQVIINIINNAKDILLEKKIKDPWVKLELSQKEDHILLTIEDNGGGIPEDVLPKIFEPYFTTKHQSQGTGLGLHMSYKIITDSIKGKIYAKNSQNGAVFYIELPQTAC